MKNASIPLDGGLWAGRVLVAVVSMSSALAAPGPADWPSWRGPKGNGSVTSGTFPTRWKLEEVTWKHPLPGKGSSSPIVWRGNIYVTTPAEGQDAVLALDMQGNQRWLTKLGPEAPPKHKTLGSSCNSSPVTDGRGIFVYFKSGHFAALELDGKVRWQTNLVEKFGQERLFWDQGSSPVVTDRDVIVARLHGGESWVAGFDKATGAMRWKEGRTYPAPTENDNGYSTPVLFEERGRQAFLIWAADRLTAHDAIDGKLLWACGDFNPASTGYWPAIATPVIHRGMAIVPAGRDDRAGQSRLHGIRLGGAGDVTQTHRAWKREDVGVFVSAPAEYDGRIYLLRHRGEIVCLDPATGNTVWSEALPRERMPFYASPSIGNGILYAAREDGVVFTVRVGDKFELLGENDMNERIVASPALADHRVLLRGDAHLFCIAAR